MRAALVWWECDYRGAVEVGAWEPSVLVEVVAVVDAGDIPETVDEGEGAGTGTVGEAVVMGELDTGEEETGREDIDGRASLTEVGVPSGVRDGWGSGSGMGGAAVLKR